MKIICVMDPICGWCYGNIENTKKLYNDFKDKVEFEVLPGGMWSGSNTRIQSVQMMNYFLKHDAVIWRRQNVYRLLFFNLAIYLYPGDSNSIAATSQTLYRCAQAFRTDW